MRRPSGEKFAWNSQTRPGVKVSCRWFEPFAFARNRSQVVNPRSQRVKTKLRPSGAKAALNSVSAVVLVRFTGLEPSAPAAQISLSPDPAWREYRMDRPVGA